MLTPHQSEIINQTVAFVKIELATIESAHDWWHIYRVWKTSKTLAATESVDMFIVELGALLHDIADSKFHNGDEEIGPATARDFLQSLGVESAVVDHVEAIVRNISFKGGKNPQVFKSLELDVVQDADRLDAIGAIGIGRTFNFGGYKGRAMHDPETKPNLNMTKEEYKLHESTTINHFYEKLLLLKDRMNTETGKRMAQGRHEYMENFLEEFDAEWEGRV